MKLSVQTDVSVGDSSKLRDWLNKNFADKLNNFSFAGIRFNIFSFGYGGFCHNNKYFDGRRKRCARDCWNGWRKNCGCRRSRNYRTPTTADEEIAILREQNELLRGILAKELGISEQQIGRAAQNYSRDYMRRTGNPAFI